MSDWIPVTERLPETGRATRCLLTVHYEHAVEDRHKRTVCVGVYDPWSNSWSWPSTATGTIYSDDEDHSVVAWAELPEAFPLTQQGTS